MYILGVNHNKLNVGERNWRLEVQEKVKRSRDRERVCVCACVWGERKYLKRRENVRREIVHEDRQSKKRDLRERERERERERIQSSD